MLLFSGLHVAAKGLYALFSFYAACCGLGG